jgi:hypothetical protein
MVCFDRLGKEHVFRAISFSAVEAEMPSFLTKFKFH